MPSCLIELCEHGQHFEGGQVTSSKWLELHVIGHGVHICHKCQWADPLTSALRRV